MTPSTINKEGGFISLMNQYELGYISAFMDGEGYLMISIRKNRPLGQVFIEGGFYNTNKKVLEDIQNIIKCGRMIYGLSRYKTTKPLHQLKLNRTALRQILPRLKLKIKNQQQKLLLEALDLTNGSYCKGIPIPDHIRSKLVELELKN